MRLKSVTAWGFERFRDTFGYRAAVTYLIVRRTEGACREPPGRLRLLYFTAVELECL